MMNKQSGQVLPLTALMMVVLLGAAAIIIDGSAMYAQQRRMQSDLDMAVKYAADTQSTSQAVNLLTQRGYANDTTPGAANKITISSNVTTPPFAGKSGSYVEGFLTQNAHAYFGKVLGANWFPFLKVSVHAVAENGGLTWQPPAMLALDNIPTDCGFTVQGGTGSSGQVTGNVDSNSQTCVKAGNVSVIGSVVSVTTTSSANGYPVSGSDNGTTGNGTGIIMPNPYNPGPPWDANPYNPIASAPIITASMPTTTTICGHQVDQGDTVYQPKTNTGVAVISTPLSMSSGNYDFLPYCGSGKTQAGIYFVENNLQMSCLNTTTCPTLNVYESTYVLDYATGARMQMTGGTLNVSGPKSTSCQFSSCAFYGKFGSIAMWQENTPTPCTAPISMKFAGVVSGTITGIVDLQCTNLTVIGNSSNGSLVDGNIIAWDITIAGSGGAVDTIDSGVTPKLPRGAVLIQ